MLKVTLKTETPYQSLEDSSASSAKTHARHVLEHPKIAKVASKGTFSSDGNVPEDSGFKLK